MNDPYVIWIQGDDEGPYPYDLGDYGMSGTAELECRGGFLIIRGLPDTDIGMFISYRLYIRFIEEHRDGADDVSRAVFPVRTRDEHTLLGDIQSFIERSSRSMGAVIKMADYADDMRHVMDLSTRMLGRMRDFVGSLGDRISDERREDMLHCISVGESYLRSLRGFL